MPATRRRCWVGSVMRARRVAERGLGLEAALAVGEGAIARGPPVARHSGVGILVPALVPVAEVIAVPRWARGEVRELQLLPDLAGGGHVLLRRQLERGHVVLERGIDHQ